MIKEYVVQSRPSFISQNCTLNSLNTKSHFDIKTLAGMIKKQKKKPVKHTKLQQCPGHFKRMQCLYIQMLKDPIHNCRYVRSRLNKALPILEPSTSSCSV